MMMNTNRPVVRYVTIGVIAIVLGALIATIAPAAVL